jgi:short-subunit dehydrogenase
MKITLITGGSSGLGFELARCYAKDGNNILLVSKNEERLNKAKTKLEEEFKNILVDIYPLDLTKIDDFPKLFEYTKSKDYFVNNLSNCAGFGDQCDFKDMDITKQIQMTNVNCNALLYFTRVYLDDMLKNNEGHIINACSIAGFLPGPYMSTYHATKGYVLLLGEAIAHEIRKTNVKLLTLCPGPFESNFVALAHNDYTFKKIKPISAESVARFGYKKSIKGKTLAIVGAKNRATIFITRFFSRKFVTKSSSNSTKKNG